MKKRDAGLVVMWYIIVKYILKYSHWNIQGTTGFILCDLFLLFIPVAKSQFLFTSNSDTAVKIQLYFKRTRLVFIFNSSLRFTCHLINDKSRIKTK